MIASSTTKSGERMGWKIFSSVSATTTSLVAHKTYLSSKSLSVLCALSYMKALLLCIKSDGFSIVRWASCCVMDFIQDGRQIKHTRRILAHDHSSADDTAHCTANLSGPLNNFALCPQRDCRKSSCESLDPSPEWVAHNTRNDRHRSGLLRIVACREFACSTTVESNVTRRPHLRHCR